MKKYLFTFLFLGFFFLVLPSGAQAANLYWVGNEGAATNVASNWKTTDPATCGGGDAGAAPGTADVAIFDPDCDNGAAITGTFDVAGVSIVSGYTGTITQNAVAMTIRASGWTQADGTFTGNSDGSTANITFQSGGDFNFTAGTFTSTNDTLTATDEWTASSGFNANSGTVVFTGAQDAGEDTITGSITLNNLTFRDDGCTNRYFSLASGTTLTVNGTLHLNETDNCNLAHLNGPGKIHAKGDVLADGDYNSSNQGFIGTAEVVLNGTGNQNLQGGDSDRNNAVPGITIDKSSGNLTITNTILVTNDFTFTQMGGGGVINGSGEIIFSPVGDANLTISGSVTLPNVGFSHDDDGIFTATIASGTTLTSSGNLGLYVDRDTNQFDIDGPGTISFQGNLTIDSSNPGQMTWEEGTVAISFTGSGSQTVTANGTTFPLGTVTFNKSGGSVVLATAWGLSNSGQDLLVAASSTQTLTGAFTLTVNDVTTIAGTLTQATSTIQSGTFSIGSGGTWNNSSTGDIIVGTGGISNSGGMFFTGSTGCGVSDVISVTSSSGGASRTWSGSGAFYLTDVSLQDQTTSLGLTAYSSTNVSGNSGFTFNSNCPLATAHWKFDEGYGTTTYDSVNDSADGTLSGTTLPAWKTEDLCISGKCLYFDGTTSYVSVASSFPEVKSIGFWVRPNSITSTALISLNNAAQTITATSGTIATSGITSPTIYVNGVVSTTIAANTWNYIEVTTSTSINVGSIHIGKSASTYLQGFMDEVKVYNTTRTAAEVKAGYLARGTYTNPSVQFTSPNLKSLSEGLVGYWSLDESSGNITDYSGNSASLVNHATATFPGGKFGHATDLESGSSQYFSYDANDPSLSEVGYNSNTGTGSSPTVTLPGGVIEDDLIVLSVAINDNQTISVSGYTEISSSPGVDSSDFVKVATFYKVAGASESNPTITIGVSSEYRWIVYVIRGADPTTPVLDNGEVIDSSFSATQAMPTLNASGNTVWSLVFFGSEGFGGSISSWPAGWSTKTSIDISGSAVFTLGTNEAPGTGSIGGGTITEDQAKNSVAHHLLILNAPPAASSPPQLTLQSSLSVSSWIKPESNTASTQYNIAGKWDSGEEGYLLSQYGDEVRLYIDSASNYVETSSANLATGTWYHVVGTYDALLQTAKIYINGIETATTISGTIPSSITNTAGRFHIGAANSYATPNNFFDGVIDEARVYNKALTKSEISQLYQWTPGPVATWSFDENSGGAAYDTSGTGLQLGTASLATPVVMAHGNLDSGNAQTITTSSLSPTVGKKLLLFVSAGRNGHTNSFNWGITASAGTTPSVLATSSTYSWAGDANYAIQTRLYELDVDTSGSRTFTFDAKISSTATFYYSYIVIEVTDGSYSQATVSNGANINPSSSSASGSLTLGGNPVSGHQVIVFAAKGNDGAGALSTPSGYTELANQTEIWNSAGAFYHSSTTSPTATFTDLGETVGNWAGFILELEAVPSPINWTSGKFGSSISFDGNDSGKTLDEVSAIDLGATTDSYTISSWINTTTNGAGTAAIIAKNDGSGAYPYHLYLNSSEQACFQISDGTNSPSVCGSTALNDGQWHYVTGIRNVVADALYLYVDGIYIGTTTDTTTATAANDDRLSIGNSGASYTANDFTGSIDDVKIYSYPRTSSQIIQDMNAGHPIGGSPIASQVGYWKLDEQGGQTVYDSGFGDNDGTRGANSTPSTDDPTWNVAESSSCKVNGCMSFDGSADYVNIPDSADLRPENGSWTTTGWAKSSAPSGTDYPIVTKRQNGSPFEMWGMYIGDGGRLQAYLIEAFSTSRRISSTISNVADNTWHHYAAVFDKSQDKILLYVDGKPVYASLDNTGSWPTVNNTDPVNIGNSNGGGALMLGSIDEVKVYNSALTADEIKLDYNAGSAAAFGGVLGAQDNEGFGGNAPLVYWPFDENTGTSTTLDKSGNENAGTLTSIVSSSWIPGKFGSGLTLDGTADYIGNTDLVTSFTGDLTVGVWFKTGTLPGAQSRILDLAQASTLGLQLSMVSDGRVGLDNTGGPTTGCFTTGTYHDNKWHFMQVTRSGTTYTVYVDGGVETCTDTGTAPTYDDLYVGRVSPGAGTSFFAGSVDEVKVYNYVRTAAQRAYDYNRGGALFSYKLDECTGANAYNSAVVATGEAAGSNGTITPGASGNTATGDCGSGTGTEMWNDGTTGKRNGSLGFDGIDDYVDLGSNTLGSRLNRAGGITLSAWINPTSFPADNSRERFVNIWINGGDTGAALSIFDDSGLLEIGGRSQAADSFATVRFALPGLSQWTHVVGVLDFPNDMAHLYINGKLVASEPETFGSNIYVDGTPSSNDTLGAASSSNESFNGLLDEVRVYNYPLSSNQIKRIFNNGAAFFGPNEGEP